MLLSQGAAARFAASGDVKAVSFVCLYLLFYVFVVWFGCLFVAVLYFVTFMLCESGILGITGGSRGLLGACSSRMGCKGLRGGYLHGMIEGHKYIRSAQVRAYDDRA